MRRFLSPRQAAQSLGVSESSLKRWCDRGQMQSERTAGGHRRIPIPVVVRFLRDNQFQAVRPDILGLPIGMGRCSQPLGDSIDILTEALVQGDATASRRIVFEYFLHGHEVAGVCDDLLAPALSQIGHRWKCGSVEVFEERRAVELTVRMLHELRISLETTETHKLTALGSSIEGDTYELPTRMVELTLLDCGWKASSLGSSLPFDTLLRAIHKNQPRLFWLSASLVNATEHFVESLNTFCSQVPVSTAVVLGGRALTNDVRERIAKATFFDNLQQLAAYAAQLKTNEISKAG
jgi:excisionase family DNA binding protein